MLTLIFSSLILAPPKDEPKPEKGLLLPEAQEVVRQYAEEVAAIRERHQRKIEPLEERMQAELKATSETATDRLKKLQDAEENLVLPEAQEAVRQYTEEVAAIRERHQKRVTPLEEKMQAEMEAKAKAAIVRLMKLHDASKNAGNLEAALAIKGTIAAMSEDLTGGNAASDAVEFRGHRYQFMDDKLTWHMAKARCEELGGHLVTIENPAELAFIATLAKGRVAWLGGTDEQIEGEWEWVTGEPWTQGTKGFDDKDGSQHWLRIDGKGKWDDGDAGWRMAFICEWE
jgi:Skp family chaperone for outer membrane proteins